MKKVITMKKREDGYYVKTVTVTAPSGKKVRKSFYGKTQRELTRKMTEFKEIDERGRTFGEVAKDWWEEAEPELAIQTVHGYKVGLDRAIGEFGDTAIKDISARDISLYLAKLAEDDIQSQNRLQSDLLIRHYCRRYQSESVLRCSSPERTEKTAENRRL